MTIRGTGFTGATSVTIGGATCTPPFPQSSDSYYSCTTGARAAGNSLSVEVTTPSGTNAPNTLYTYADVAPTPAPTVAAISPAEGPSAGGQAVTISGSGFTGATAVTIGGSACVPLTVISDSAISCSTTPHAAGGPFSVDVTTPEGTNEPNALYIYSASAATDIQAIPTLSEWSLWVLMTLMLLVTLRRRQG
ncbi:MAG: IPT/TIG domain-containing protein [Burkholderiales bacterium]|nr:IPT/TIG domain-containing protein [Burkholderiales bacterium]